MDEAARKEMVSFNSNLLKVLDKGMKSIGGDVRVLKSGYTADGIHATLLFKERGEKVGRYNLELTKQYGVTPDLPEDKMEQQEAKGEKWIIKDWAGNVFFGGKKFDSFDDAEEFLSKTLGNEYETDRGEYEVIPDKGSRDKNYLDPKDPRAGKVVKEAKIEFEPEAIVDDLCKALGEEHREEITDSLEIGKGRYSSLGDAGEFRADGTTYNFIKDEDEAERIAKDIVRQDLESEPEMFSKDFIQHHLSMTPTDRRIVAGEEADSQVDGLDNDEIKERAEEEGYDKEVDVDDEKQVADAKSYLIGELAEKIEKELLDPIQYFVHDHGMYDIEDLMKANFINIDVDEATDEAVRIDGWSHFLSHYDGNYETTPGGIVYFRED